MGKFDVGNSPYYQIGELLERGFDFVPVANGGANLVAALRKGSDTYLCFLADKEEWQKERQSELLRFIDEGGERNDIPNIPIICVKVE